MCFSAPAPPTPPSAASVAAAQGASNQTTAAVQSALNSTNQVTPYGNLTYTQGPNRSIVDPSNPTHNISVPNFTATQTLTPQSQHLLDTSLGTQQNLANTAKQQSGFLQNYLGTPADLSNKATEDRLDQLAHDRLDPIMQQQQNSLQSQLAAKGINPGTPAYDHAMQQFSNSRNDANNQLILNGNQQAFSQAQAARNQPINEITALMSGSQVSQPNFVNTPQSGVAPTDVVGANASNFAGQMGVYNAQTSQQNAMNGGLFGLGSAAIGGWALSDPDLKTDKQKIGKTKSGLGLYSYRFKTEPKGVKRIGLMADEVQKKHPSAVKRIGGTGPRMVNYQKALANG